jgi:hypothetical protein
VPNNQWMDKENMTYMYYLHMYIQHIYSEYYSE